MAPGQNATVSHQHFLGLDAGGTATRWALVDAHGELVNEGQAGACSGLQLMDTVGTEAIAGALRAIAAEAGPLAGIAVGMTGLGDAQAPTLRTLLSTTFGVAATQTRAFNDIELLCRATFAPGAGLVLYAGTGAIAALVDAQGTLQRAGGRGHLIDDAGGGHWIAREALKHVWRAEDETPGAWRSSPLARALFERIGGADWVHTRAWVYGAARGEMGTLALAVAEAASQGDATARALLHTAGEELARLARALLQRFGTLPVALAGRVFELHPTIETAVREAMPGTPLQRLHTPPHHAAARLAAGLHTA